MVITIENGIKINTKESYEIDNEIHIFTSAFITNGMGIEVNKNTKKYIQCYQLPF